MMPITFNADELFEMAEKIERNGLKFYRKAAECVSDSRLQRLFGELADMEAEHIRIFKDMRKQLSDTQSQPIVFDPDNQAALYLQAMADGHVFDMKKDLSTELTEATNAADIIKQAIEAEKDSIVFYVGLKQFVPERAGRDKVEHIIAEEMFHVSQLSAKLKKLE